MTARQMLKYHIVNALIKSDYQEHEVWMVAEQLRNKTQSAYTPSARGWGRFIAECIKFAKSEKVNREYHPKRWDKYKK